LDLKKIGSVKEHRDELFCAPYSFENMISDTKTQVYHNNKGSILILVFLVDWVYAAQELHI